jgi:E3 ubiquitin-protein ligase EDD1
LNYIFDSVSLREMMRRASSAARAVSGLDVREQEEGMAIPTLSWPPDPPSYESVIRQGMIKFDTSF